MAEFGKDGLRDFDTAITNFQMQIYVTVYSFEYAHNKCGKPYGWEIACYAIADDVLCTEITYDRSSEESRSRISNHLGLLYPNVFGDNLEKSIR